MAVRLSVLVPAYQEHRTRGGASSFVVRRLALPLAIVLLAYARAAVAQPMCGNDPSPPYDAWGCQKLCINKPMDVAAG
jgi:hypothetical protein